MYYLTLRRKKLKRSLWGDLGWGKGRNLHKKIQQRLRYAPVMPRFDLYHHPNIRFTSMHSYTPISLGVVCMHTHHKGINRPRHFGPSRAS